MISVRGQDVATASIWNFDVYPWGLLHSHRLPCILWPLRIFIRRHSTIWVDKSNIEKSDFCLFALIHNLVQTISNSFNFFANFDSTLTREKNFLGKLWIENCYQDL